MKRYSILCAALTVAGTVFAGINPPLPGGEMLLLWGHPKFIGAANSTTGGPLFNEGSFAMAMNPALTASLQFPAVDFGFSGLIPTKEETEGGGGLRLGGAFPTRWGVFSVGGQGIFADEAGFGNAGIFRMGFARDVTDNLYLGIGVTGGFLDSSVKSVEDFLIAADVGAWYRVPKIAFLRDVRFAVAVQNFGKTFTKFDDYLPFPSIITPKAGVAATLFAVKKFELGMSADVAVPSLAFPPFINITVNTGMQAKINDMVFVSVGWDFNLRETAEYNKDVLHGPYISAGLRYKFDTSGNAFMHKRSLNEIVADFDGAWQQHHLKTHYFTAGVSAVFGERDMDAPVITPGEIRYDAP